MSAVQIRWMIRGAIVGFFVALLLAHSQAQAQGVRMPCHNAAEIAKQLSEKYEEAPVAFGLQSNGNLLQVYASSQKDTWTVVSTTPNGLSCIVAAGKHFEMLPAVLGEPS